MVSSHESSDESFSSDEQNQSFDHENAESQQTQHQIHTPRSEKGRSTTSIEVKAAREPIAAVSQSSHREGSNREKTLQRLVSLESSDEGNFEKVLGDGYNWRKYGQKQVRGNEFTRSYYRCTSPNCSAKKQVECSNIGKLTDTAYFGQHNHPKPHSDIPNAVSFDMAVVQEALNVPIPNKGAQPAVEHGYTHSKDSPSDNAKCIHSGPIRLLKDKARKERGLEPKRRRKSDDHGDPSPFEKSSGEPRFVVQTRSEVDFINDGYRWRKYGQKLVKGNPNPRSYYRCSSPLCPAKKHVERASYDAKVVITTYEANHNHDLPPSRMVTVQSITNQADGRAKPVCTPIEVSASDGVSLERDVRSDKQLNGERKTVSAVDDVVTHPAKDSETETRHLEQYLQNRKSVQEHASVGTDGKGHVSIPDETVNVDQKRTESEQSAAVHQDVAMQDSSDRERYKDTQAKPAPNSLQC